MESNELKKKNIQTSREEIDYGSVNLRKVAVIGCGFVGSASAFALMQSGMFSEMVLIDADHDKAEGEALDISHGTPFARPMKIYASFALRIFEFLAQSLSDNCFGRLLRNHIFRPCRFLPSCAFCFAVVRGCRKYIPSLPC